MSLPPEPEASLYNRLQSQSVGGGKTAFGFDENWMAPFAIFDAKQGFGKEPWFDAIPATVVATPLHGASVAWHCGKHRGRTSGIASVVLQPKGTPDHSHADRAIRFGQVYLPDRLIDRVADAIRPGATASGNLRDDLVFVPDRELDRRATACVAAAMTGGSALEQEANAILLIGHLLRVYRGFGDATPARGGLAPWQLKRACEAMVAYLCDDIALDMLAGIAGCSPTHFSRAFKQSMGVPPFQWLLERRIERARALLGDPRTSLAEIALAVGFAAQPQFTTDFRRMTGLTPGVWRRERLT